MLGLSVARFSKNTMILSEDTGKKNIKTVPIQSLQGTCRNVASLTFAMFSWESLLQSESWLSAYWDVERSLRKEILKVWPAHLHTLYGDLLASQQWAVVSTGISMTPANWGFLLKLRQNRLFPRSVNCKYERAFPGSLMAYLLSKGIQLCNFK